MLDIKSIKLIITYISSVYIEHQLCDEFAHGSNYQSLKYEYKYKYSISGFCSH